MVGDCSYDVDGVVVYGIDMVVVGWGYGCVDFIDKIFIIVVMYVVMIDELREVLGV